MNADPKDSPLRALIVHAHPEPASFNAALRDTAERTLRERGAEVAVSDLYAQRFEAVAGRDDFLALHNPERLAYVHEQRRATARQTFLRASALGWHGVDNRTVDAGSDLVHRRSATRQHSKRRLFARRLFCD